jgi:hypothetical protein
MRFLGLTFALAIAAPALAHAQSPVYQDAMQASATLQIAAQQSNAPIQWTVPESRFAANAERVAVQRDFNSRQPGATMMIIGGAALLAGLLTDGSASTALIIGGIGFGAYGFYLYNR